MKSLCLAFPLRGNARMWLGGGVLTALILVAILAPWLAPHDPVEQSLLNQLLPPAWFAGGDPNYPLGTDALGRDLLSRLLFGTRPALLVMLAGAAASALVGVALGIFAGYFGGKVDAVISRVLEVFMSFPPMLLAIVLAAVIGPGLMTVIMAVIIIGWTRFCRVIRGEVQALKEQDFIMSARAIGMRPLRVVLHEILPNVLPIMMVLFGLEMGRAIVVEAILSFIGFSSSSVATWGGIIADGRAYINQAWWVLAAPILVIIIMVLSLNAFCDGTQQAVDPVLQR
ncbi:ABC transporter permease [Pusillimonas noertemannii]|uniref:Peptide/nickel transport system permease protein n=1 Tax=Pusillimonas noertemannii TaxID=305977 RepID=A0A2U1CKZ8_9BURK|nr:ABC transporter permease [Pusillimonas noertemannii]NYT69197.1 ABC transporter permease [Pusillimonas noertemannii]PVY61665.1 peptide/nickel transport system permease protein [Pusillimonas noertemannii]TFL09606.1 ABC transporter permease [Pusillimonas noertemannii]